MDIDEARDQIEELEVEPVSVDLMAPKAIHLNLLVERVRSPVAIILKESMLAVGADAAIHRDSITGKIKNCDVLVMATRKQLRKAAPNLKMQPFGISELAVEMLRAADNYYTTPAPWELPGHGEMTFDKIRLMGVINVTPDSFSGDGIPNDIDAIVERAVRMEKDGADIIDVGGESTRPGADPVSEKVEIKRVIPVIRQLSDEIEIPVSVDTRKAAVAKAAIEAGASVVNDVNGLFNRDIIRLCAREKTPVIAMHMKGKPKTMQEKPEYDDVIGEIMHYLANRIDDAVDGGIEREQIAIDPGIGFGKRLEDNLEIIRRLSEFKTLGLPIVIGVSRKSFIGKITGLKADERVEGSIGAACVAAWNGANIIRCHDVRETRLALQIVESIKFNNLSRG